MNIIESTQNTRVFEDIRRSITEVGGTAPEHLSCVGKAIREQLVAGPKAVVNASLVSGKGVKICPIERKGYKISANSGASLIAPVGDIDAGATVQDALNYLATKAIPGAERNAAKAPHIVGVEYVKIPHDGCDYYDNKAYGSCGVGRKTGLVPNTWYLKLTLFSQVEPVYVSCGPLMSDLKREIMEEMRRMLDGFKDQCKKRETPKEENHADCTCGCMGYYKEPCPLCIKPEPKPEPENCGPWIVPEQADSCKESTEESAIAHNGYDEDSCDFACEPKLDVNFIIESIR